jgi:hypothetical protein
VQKSAASYPSKVINSASSSGQPGAYYHQRPMAQCTRSLSPMPGHMKQSGPVSSGPARGHSLSPGHPKRATTTCSANQARDGDEMDDDILRKIAANTPAITSLHPKSPAQVARVGAQSGDDLDEDILQMIAANSLVGSSGQCQQPHTQAGGEAKCPGANEKDEASKNAAPCSSTVSGNDVASSSPPNSGKTSKGALRKAADGFKKIGLPFRKHKDR